MIGRPAIVPAVANRRALILPGGGMRVAWQAGVIKALHNAGLRFSFADGASGGTMNLAALLSGVTPDDLCRRWRGLPVTAFVSLRPLAAYARFPRTGALGDFDGIERTVFPHLGIDLGKLRTAGGISATFNVCDFTDKVSVAVPHTQLVHEQLLASISLPLATPAVPYRGKWWTDAVWVRDSNLMAAVKSGANELWIAWCIGNTPRFKTGLLEQYVHMIEMSAIGKLNEELAEIAALNERIQAGAMPFGHDTPIAVHVVKPEKPIPLDPDFLTGKIDATTLIAYGYRDAHRALASRTPAPLSPGATRMTERGNGVHFRETMTGRICWGQSDPDTGYNSPAAEPVALHAVIDIDDMRPFVIDPDHQEALTGHLEWHRSGGWTPAVKGIFGLFTPSRDPDLVYMVYAMQAMIAGRLHYFNGRKRVRIAAPWKLWKATTTLYVTVHKGPDITGPIVAAGKLSLGIGALMKLLSTMQGTPGASLTARSGAIWRFFRFFAGELMRIYLFRRRR